MPVEMTELDGYVKFTATGSLVARDVREAPSSSATNRLMPRILWDVRNADLSVFLADDYKELTEYLASRAAYREPGARTAVLAGDTPNFNIMRIIADRRNHILPDVLMQVFMDEQEALAWLFSDDGTSVA